MGRAQPARAPGSSLEPRAAGCWRCPHTGRALGRSTDTAGGQLTHQTRGHVAPRMGLRKTPPLPVSSALRLPRRGSCFSRGFHSPHPTPTHQNLQPLVPGTGPAHPARGGRCQGSLPTPTSSLGQETPAGHKHKPGTRANSGHPQRQLRAQTTAGPAGNLIWGVTKCQAPCWSLPPYPVALSISTSIFLCLPCPQRLQSDPS